MKQQARDWLLAAEMDLRSIERMLDDEFLAPVACFHAQQCVEKSLKAILEAHGVHYPKIHDLLRLYGMVSERVDLGLLPHGRPTPEDARQFYEFAADVYRKAREMIARTIDF